MKLKSVLLLAVAVGCGLIAMLGVQQALSGNKDGDSDKEKAQVLVAVTRIDPGTPLNETNVKFKEWSRDNLPEGAVTNREQYEQRALLMGAVPGEIVMRAKLGEKGVFGASAEIPKGMRVISVPVNSTMTMSGLMLPGDRVDVLVTYQTSSGVRRKSSKTKTVLEYIEVFATDSRREITSDEEKKNLKVENVSLLVTPKQANILKLAEKKGEIHLSLRHKSDKDQTELAEVDDSLFETIAPSLGEDKPEPAAVQAPSEEDIRAFLEKQSALQDQQKQVLEDEQKSWEIEIFSGEEKRVEQVDLFDEEKETVSPVKETELTAVGANDLDNHQEMLQDFLKHFFNN